MGNFTNIFDEYKIIYIIYTILAAVILLVLIKILAFVFYLLSLYKIAVKCLRISKNLELG